MLYVVEILNFSRFVLTQKLVTKKCHTCIRGEQTTTKCAEKMINCTSTEHETAGRQKVPEGARSVPEVYHKCARNVPEITPQQ